MKDLTLAYENTNTEKSTVVIDLRHCTCKDLHFQEKSCSKVHYGVELTAH